MHRPTVRKRTRGARGDDRASSRVGRNQERRATIEGAITVDRNLAFQQNIPQFTIAVIVLESPTNRLKDLRPLLPKLQQLLLKVRKGEISRVSL